MKTLLYLTGQIDNPFFINEIKYFVKSFDRVVVIAYAENKKSRYKQIAQKYNFQYRLLDDGIRLRELFFFLKLLRTKPARKEIREKCKGKKFIRKFAYILLYILNASKTYFSVKKMRIDGNIYIYSFWLSRGAYAASILKQILNPCKVISRAHGYDVYEERNNIGYLPFREYIAQSFDEIAFISMDGYQYFKTLCDDHNYKYNKLSMIHLGSTLPLIRPRVKKDMDDGLTVASCSSIISLKRLDIIIDFVSQLNELGMSTKWIHIGEGKEKKTIETYARTKIKGNYCLLGWIDNSEIYALYEKYNVNFFINMSDSEGIPVSIMEAISVGIPVIARNVGGVSEIVNQKTGILIENVVTEEILRKAAEEVVYLYRDKVKYELLSASAKKYWEEEFDIESNVKKIIRELCDANEF